MTASAADLAATVRDYFACTPLTPNERLGIAALDALLARCQEAERRAEGWVQHDTKAYAEQALRALARAEAAEAERDEARAQFGTANREWGVCAARMQTAEARVAQLEQAINVAMTADPTFLGDARVTTWWTNVAGVLRHALQSGGSEG